MRDSRALARVVVEAYPSTIGGVDGPKSLSDIRPSVPWYSIQRDESVDTLANHVPRCSSRRANCNDAGVSRYSGPGIEAAWRPHCCPCRRDFPVVNRKSSGGGAESVSIKLWFAAWHL